MGSAYLFTGMMESFSSFFMYFYYVTNYAKISPVKLFFLFNGWTEGFEGYSQDQINEFYWTAQSVYFVSLVIIQFGNLLATRTRHLSFFQHQPWNRKTSNKYLIFAILISLGLALIVIYVPFFNTVFKTRPIPVECWFIPIGFASWIFVSDEVRKLLVRKFPESFVAKIAW